MMIQDPSLTEDINSHSAPGLTLARRKPTACVYNRFRTAAVKIVLHRQFSRRLSIEHDFRFRLGVGRLTDPPVSHQAFGALTGVIRHVGGTVGSHTHGVVRALTTGTRRARINGTMKALTALLSFSGVPSLRTTTVS